MNNKKIITYNSYTNSISGISYNSTPIRRDWSQLPFVVRYNNVKSKIWSCKKMEIENISDEIVDRNKRNNKKQFRVINHTNTICQICDSKETYINSNRRPIWHKYKISENENLSIKGTSCNNKSYICDLCYHKERQKANAKCRNKELSKDSTLGKGFIGEQIWCKVRGVKNCNIEMDNFTYKHDHSPDKEYGIVNTKIATKISRSKHSDRWSFDTKGEYDNVVLFCMDKERKNVERAYIIPKEVLENRRIVDIVQSSTKYSWYEKYRVNEKSYNEAYHSMNLKECPVLKND